MNERIKELVKQSLVWNDEGDECDVDLSKFAELIVAECAKVAVEAESTGVARLIMIHFGVEE